MTLTNEQRQRRLQSCLVSESDDLRSVLARIDAGGVQLALVLGDSGTLVGTASDGDIRRALLAGSELRDPIGTVCNRAFRALPASTATQEIFRELKLRQVHQMPIVDDGGRPVDLITVDDLLEPERHNNLVVIMAGGLGQRMGELTRAQPKPMLPIAGRPLIEHLVRNFQEQGFRRFRLAVNYRSEMIEDHFGDGSRLDCEICYLRERERRGTAGALSLLEEPNNEPLVVVNGDLIVQVRLGEMMAHHESSGADATMAVRQYDYQVPYGVIEQADGRIVGLVEKPLQSHLISAGLYVLSEAARRRVPADRPFDMPELFSAIIGGGGRAAVFPIDGYWADVGTTQEYSRVAEEHAK